MTDPETLEEAKSLIAMLQKKGEHLLDQREEARAYANSLVQGFAKRADALKVVMRQGKKAIGALLEQVEPSTAGAVHARELGNAASDALDQALTR